MTTESKVCENEASAYWWILNYLRALHALLALTLFY